MNYSHRFHAGNVGDVWKHLALVQVLERVAAGPQRVTYIDTHAGEGAYALGATGEWTEGVGRLWAEAAGTGERVTPQWRAAHVHADATSAQVHRAGTGVERYLNLVRRLATGSGRPERYPGSPAFARAVLGPRACLSLWESDPTAGSRLREHVGRDVQTAKAKLETQVHDGDGLAALAEESKGAEARGDRVVVLVDPAWTRKADWTEVPDALARAVHASSSACFLLWYPVKSLTRPNAMIARLAAARVAGAIAELITTSLEHQRQRLNGSGVLLVRAPAEALQSIAAAAPAIGERCATCEGVWSFRMHSWAAEPAR